MENSQQSSLNALLRFTLADGSEMSYSQVFALSRVPPEEGPKLLAAQLFAEVEKELRFGARWDALPQVGDLSQSAPRTLSMDEIVNGREISVHNTREMWREITNTLLGVNYLLAQAGAYKDVKSSAEAAGNGENDIAMVHISMVESFDQAVSLLARVEDLFLLLLFVNLWTTSSSIVDVDLSLPDWDRSITWKSVKKGLTDRSRMPGDVADPECAAILDVVDSYQRTGALERIAGYRNRIMHTLHPAVDDPKFSAFLCFPKQRSKGVLDMSIGIPTVAEFDFSDLYRDAVEALKQVVTVLRKLKEIPRFS